jgi:hypothetical protein
MIFLKNNSLYITWSKDLIKVWNFIWNIIQDGEYVMTECEW